jgi:hypothetical protein
MLDPMGATIAPLHRIYVEDKKTFVTDVIKKFNIVISVY